MTNIWQRFRVWLDMKNAEVKARNARIYGDIHARKKEMERLKKLKETVKK